MTDYDRFFEENPREIYKREKVRNYLKSIDITYSNFNKRIVYIYINLEKDTILSCSLIEKSNCR